MFSSRLLQNVILFTLLLAYSVLIVCLFLLFGKFPLSLSCIKLYDKIDDIHIFGPLVLLLLSYVHIMSRLLNKDKNGNGKMSAFYRVDNIFVGTSCQANGGDTKR